PPSITETYNISNLSTSISADSYYSTSTFLKDQDVYVAFDVNSMQANTPFESRWYYGVNIFGKEVYVLVSTAAQVSEAGDSKMYFYLNKPAMKGYYRVDIYMNGNLVGTRYFSVQ